jgi:hypothetical protein
MSQRQTQEQGHVVQDQSQVQLEINTSKQEAQVKFRIVQSGIFFCPVRSLIDLVELNPPSQLTLCYRYEHGVLDRKNLATFAQIPNK